MFYRKQQDIIHVNFLMDNGGIGDLIGTIPCLDYTYKFHPQVVIHFWCPDYAVDLAERSLPNDKQRIIIRGFSDKDKFKKEFFGRALAIHKTTNLGYHITKQAFSVLINEEVEDQYLSYLPVRNEDIKVDKFNLPEKYVCMSTGFTAPVREFLPEHVNKVISYIKEKGYEVIFLGNEKTTNGAGHTIVGNFKKEINFNEGINLINQTTLLEGHKIISGSKAFLGLDNGLCHLAMTIPGLPVVMGFTTVKPMHRIAYRDGVLGKDVYPVVPPESLVCRFCQSHFQFTYFKDTAKRIQHDFKYCFYKERREDTEIQCIKQLTGDLYIKELEKVL